MYSAILRRSVSRWMPRISAALDWLLSLLFNASSIARLSTDFMLKLPTTCSSVASWRCSVRVFMKRTMPTVEMMWPILIVAVLTMLYGLGKLLALVLLLLALWLLLLRPAIETAAKDAVWPVVAGGKAGDTSVEMEQQFGTIVIRKAIALLPNIGRSDAIDAVVVAAAPRDLRPKSRGGGHAEAPRLSRAPARLRLPVHHPPGQQEGRHPADRP